MNSLIFNFFLFYLFDACVEGPETTVIRVVNMWEKVLSGDDG